MQSDDPAPWSGTLENDEGCALLRTHIEQLRDKVSARQFTKLVMGIEYAIVMARHERARHEHPDDDDLGSAFETYAHDVEVRRDHAAGLLAALQHGIRPPWGNLNDDLKLGTAERQQFERMLTYVIESSVGPIAMGESLRADRQQPRPGRKAKAWRDRLISLIWAHFPNSSEVDPRGDGYFVNLVTLAIE